MLTMNCGRSLAPAALMLVLLAQVTSAKDFNMVVRAVDCAGRPLVNAKVCLSGCVDDSHDNPKAQPVYKITTADGIAAFTQANADNNKDTEDVIQYCRKSAGRTCKLSVDISNVPNSEGIVFDTYEVPIPPKIRVRDSCHCNVCKQYKYGGVCPKSVDFPGCGDSKVIMLYPKSCKVDYTESSCIPGNVCGTDQGALCHNQGCDAITANYLFCSYGGSPPYQMTLSFTCPAAGTLNLKAKAQREGRTGCGIQDGLQVQKVVNNGVPETILGYSFKDQKYDVDLSLSCDADTVYTVTENVGIILIDDVQADFTPAAISGY